MSPKRFGVWYKCVKDYLHSKFHHNRRYGHIISISCFVLTFFLKSEMTEVDLSLVNVEREGVDWYSYNLQTLLKLNMTLKHAAIWVPAEL